MSRGVSEMEERIAHWTGEHGDVLEIVWEQYASDGAWPDPARLTRERFMQRPRRNYTAIAEQMPTPLGGLRLVGQGTERVVALTPRALTHVAGARPLLDDFLRLIRLAVKRFAEPAQPPFVRSTELPVSEERARQLDEMAMADSWLLRPHGGEPGALQLAIDERAAMAVAEVATLEEYFDAQAEAWWRSPALPHLLPPAPTPVDAADAAVEPTFRLALDELHPTVVDACVSHFESGHPADAVRHAVTAVLDELRALAGLELDGEQLVGRALGSNGEVVVADLRTETGRSIQRGVLQIMQGVVAAIRNPLAHRRIEMDQSEALEQVALLSFAMRQIEDARGAPPEWGGAAPASAAQRNA
ncbi:MAG: TIGR02391 family protein [Conexibacter sp.]